MNENEKELEGFEEEDYDNIVYLSDEEGTEIAFEFVDEIQYEGNTYVVLLPVDEEDSEEVVILMAEEGEEESYVSVEDEATLQAVFDIFKDKYQDVFDFND